MKTLGFCLLILSLSVLQLKALDYGTPANTWTGATCTTNSVFQSPAKLLGERCAPYETFTIDLKAPGSSALADTSATTGSYEMTYTEGSLNVDGKAWTTTKVWFRSPAEHHLPHVSMTDSVEMQVVLTTGSDTGVLSFIFFSEDKGEGYKNALPTTPIISAFSTGSATVDFPALTTAINQKISNGLYLNMFTYRGTLTDTTCTEATWYIYGSPFVVSSAVYTAINSACTGAVSPVSADGGNNREIGVTGGGKGSLAATRLCYTGYFKNYMNYNYGLWFGVTIIVGWFIVNLMLGEKPIKDTEYQENTWTNHPLYSIYHIGNDLFTRKTRMSLLLGTITIHALFSSVWYRRTKEENRDRGSNIIVYAVYSMLVDWAFIFIIGSMLRGYYIAKHQYYKTKEEAWEQKSQNRLFAFYFCIFLLAAILWPFTVWNMGELHPEKDQKASDYWVASFFVGLALELLIADPLICILAKSITPLRNFIKNRGYMYDHICHETYLDHLKVE